MVYNKNPVVFSPLRQTPAGHIEAVLGDDAWQGLALGCSDHQPVALRLKTVNGQVFLEGKAQPGESLLWGPDAVHELQRGGTLSSYRPLVGYSLSLGEHGFRYQVLP